MTTQQILHQSALEHEDPQEDPQDDDFQYWEGILNRTTAWLLEAYDD